MIQLELGIGAEKVFGPEAFYAMRCKAMRGAHRLSCHSEHPETRLGLMKIRTRYVHFFSAGLTLESLSLSFLIKMS